MGNQELIAKAKSQAAILYTAHSLAFALRIWAKSEGWFGTNKWIENWQDGLRHDVNDLLKDIADYLGEVPSVPSVPEIICRAADLPDCYRQIEAAMREAQMGWSEFALMSEKAGQMDIAELCDHPMKDLREDIKKLVRFNRYLKRAAGDTAALIAFDKARK